MITNEGMRLFGLFGRRGDTGADRPNRLIGNHDTVRGVGINPVQASGELPLEYGLHLSAFAFGQQLTDAQDDLQPRGAGCGQFAPDVFIGFAQNMAALAVAVGYALAYWMISLRVGKELAISGDVPAELGAWSAVIITGTVGVILTRKAFSQ